MHRNTIATLMPFLFALVAVAPASPPERATSDPPAGVRAEPRGIAGMERRYIVADVRSVDSAVNVATIIKITNTSGRQCDYGVEFILDNQSTPLCKMIRNNRAHLFTTIFCFRNVPDASGANIAPCSVVCDPDLTSHDGKALIYSSESPGRCERMTVNAYVIHTSGDDSQPLAARNAAIVKWNKGEPLRSNKGD
ncbi:MAG TPA: hypothetical protein VGA77_03995 [Propylenella sp.]